MRAAAAESHSEIHRARREISVITGRYRSLKLLVRTGLSIEMPELRFAEIALPDPSGAGRLRPAPPSPLRAVLKSRVPTTARAQAAGRSCRCCATLHRAGGDRPRICTGLHNARTTVDADEIIHDFEVATTAAAASQSTLTPSRLEEPRQRRLSRRLAIVKESKTPMPRVIDRALARCATRLVR
jgi:hypothetical protein